TFTSLNGANPSTFDTTQIYTVASVSSDGMSFTFKNANGNVNTTLAATGGALTAADPYAPLPALPITFSLTAQNPIPDPDPDKDPADGWHGKFTAPPPQLRNITASPPSSDALGNTLAGTDPNLPTIEFDFRTTDLTNTFLRLYRDYDAVGGDGQLIMSLRASDLQNVSA